MLKEFDKLILSDGADTPDCLFHSLKIELLPKYDGYCAS